MNYVGGQRAKHERIRLAQTVVNLDLARAFHPDPRCLQIQHLQQRVVILIEQNGSAGGGPQLHRPANVIDVSVGNDDLFDLKVVLLDEFQNVFNIVAGIDDHRFARGFVPNH